MGTVQIDLNIVCGCERGLLVLWGVVVGWWVEEVAGLRCN